MLRFKNRNSIPITPKSYTMPNGRRIPFDSVRETWEDFINRVMAYADANGLERPATDAIEDSICQQVAGWACVSQEEYNRLVSRTAQRATSTQPVAVAAPKKKCCGRK